MTDHNPYDSPISHPDEKRNHSKVIGVVSVAVAVVFVIQLVVAGAASLLWLNAPMEVPNAQVGPIAEPIAPSPPKPSDHLAPNPIVPELPPSTESGPPVTE